MATVSASPAQQPQEQVLLVDGDELPDRDQAGPAETVTSLTDDGAAHGYLLVWPGPAMMTARYVRPTMRVGRRCGVSDGTDVDRRDSCDLGDPHREDIDRCRR